MVQPLSPISLSALEILQLKSCLDAIGTNGFVQELANFALLLSDAEMILISGFFHEATPVSLFSNHSAAKKSELIEPYLAKAYILDPLYERFLEKRGDEVVRLADYAPENFVDSDYFRLFYEGFGLSDEIMAIIHMSDRAALSVSLGCTDPGAVLDSTKLRAMLPVLVSLCKRHWVSFSPEDPEGQGRLAAHLKQSFRQFGSSVLSPKEGEIVRLILKGHSSKSIALMFGNSPDTIKVHRRRIFSKLGISAQGEIVSMFLEALEKAPPGTTQDPLVFLKGAGDRPA